MFLWFFLLFETAVISSALHSSFSLRLMEHCWTSDDSEGCHHSTCSAWNSNYCLWKHWHSTLYSVLHGRTKTFSVAVAVTWKTVNPPHYITHHSWPLCTYMSDVKYGNLTNHINFKVITKNFEFWMNVGLILLDKSRSNIVCCCKDFCLHVHCKTTHAFM